MSSPSAWHPHPSPSATRWPSPAASLHISCMFIMEQHAVLIAYVLLRIGNEQIHTRKHKHSQFWTKLKNG